MGASSGDGPHGRTSATTAAFTGGGFTGAGHQGRWLTLLRDCDDLETQSGLAPTELPCPTLLRATAAAAESGPSRQLAAEMLKAVDGRHKVQTSKVPEAGPGTGKTVGNG
jgi:hypothetical protein